MTKRQRILLIACVAVYITAYIVRLSFAAAQVGILTATGVTKADAGLVTTFFYFTYGCGQLVKAFFCRRYPCRLRHRRRLYRCGTRVLCLRYHHCHPRRRDDFLALLYAASPRNAGV